MFTELKLKDIEPGENYRKHLGKAGMKELTASIKSHGVLQPIIVRKVGKKYEVIAGHRRHLAATEAGLKTIPASIVTADDAAALEISVIENSQREDPNPMDEAQGFEKLLSLGKHTAESLAKKLDKSASYVYTRLRLNDLAKDVQKALQNDKITLAHALVLLRLPEKKDQQELLDDIIDQDMSPAQARGHLDNYGMDMARAIFIADGCLNCEHRTTTQAKLFADGKPDDDRCMDAACFKRKMLQHLEALAGKESARGRDIAREADVIQAIQRKGRTIHSEKDMKPACRACEKIVFFYAEDNGRVIYGWQCPDKRHYDEVYYGIKPQPKETKEKSTVGQEQQGPSDAHQPESPIRSTARQELVDGKICCTCPACGEVIEIIIEDPAS